jgi:hypothetical protein
VEVDLENDSEESGKIGLCDFERRVVISGFGEFWSREAIVGNTFCISEKFQI